MSKVIKIYGERNSGTNYFSQLLSENFDIQLLPGKLDTNSIFTFNEWTKDVFFKLNRNKNLGWKHAYIDINLILTHSMKPIVITLTKNPYSFLLSLYKRPYHYKGQLPDSFYNFLKNSWYVRGRDNYDLKYYKNPIELWNNKNSSYIKLKETNIKHLIFTYEELLKDPNKVLIKISENCDLELNKEFSNINFSTKNDNKNFFDYQRYYLNEEWRKDISEKEVKFINSQLDDQVMKFFNYSKINF